MNIYGAKDVISDRFFTVFVAETDGAAIRNNCPNFWAVLPKKDVELYRLGTIDMSNGVILTTQQGTKVDMDSYQFPEQKAENLSSSRDSDLRAAVQMASSIDTVRGNRERAALGVNDIQA